MVVGFMGVERIVGLMRVEYVVAHMMVDVSSLAKSAYLLKTGSLQLRLLRLGFGRRVRGMICQM